MLGDVETEERRKMLERAVDFHDNQMSDFISDTLQYFRQLIRNAKRSFSSKITGANYFIEFLVKN